MTPILKALKRRINPSKPIIVVSGLPRSGTSMMMRMLDAGGLDTVVDGIREGDEDNPRGYFELERVKKLAKDDDKSWLAEAQGKTIKVISFLLKDLPDTFHYKIVFLNRHLDEVLASQEKMLQRRNEENKTDDEAMKAAFEKHLRDVRALCRERDEIDILEVRYDQVVADAAGHAVKINAFLGGELDEAAMATAVESGLYRNRTTTS